jgi:UDP-N-acetylglucosamine 2-epimerase (non-hydrolysing)
VGSGSHAEQTARIMMAFEPACLEHRPDWVIVVGDVNSTVACALTAKKLGIRVAHVEAGLRSRDMSMPEEINRLCTDAISDLLFTTDTLAVENLRNEGVASEKDPLRRQHHDRYPAPADRSPVNCRCRKALAPGQYAVLTLHRPANVDSPESLALIMGAINSRSRTEFRLSFPCTPARRPG